MAYIALYRNYRPTNFDEVAGQKHIIKTLKNAVNNKRTSHAYLFSGQRGIGKTTIARILARAVNCLNPHDGEPCNECANCKAILNNETPDIVEIDAASNNGVDEMRSLLEKVNFLPSTLSKKVYIIDEVHMLSISAFNALLKTLEEPPVHVMFILATTEPHKIPMTILSRCQRFDFKQLTNNEIVKRLDEICEAEDIHINHDAKFAIAEAAEGGMRDAVNILDQVNSYATSEITQEDVDNVTGRVSNYKLIELLNAFYNKDAKESLKIVDDLLDMGKEIGRLTNNLIQFLRDILLYKNKAEVIEHKNIYESNEFKELANKLDVSSIFYYIEVLMDAANKFKFSNSSKIYLEVAIMKIISSYKDENNFQTEIDEIKNDLASKGMTNGLNSDSNFKVAELDQKVNKILEELNRLGLQDFKEETLSKINFLEELATNSSSLPKEMNDKIKAIETQIAGINITNNVLHTELEEGVDNKSALKVEELVKNNEDILKTIAEIKETIENNKKDIEEVKLSRSDSQVSKIDNNWDSKFEEIESSIELLMNCVSELEKKAVSNNNTSNIDLSEYRKEVEELKDNYLILIQKFVNNNNEGSNVNEISSSEDNIELEQRILNNVKTLIENNKSSLSDDVLNDLLTKNYNLEKLLQDQVENINLTKDEIINKINEEKALREELSHSVLDLKEKLEVISSNIKTLEVKLSNVQNSNIEERFTEVNKYIEDVKEYNLKLKLQVNNLEEKLINSKPIEKLEKVNENVNQSMQTESSLDNHQEKVSEEIITKDEKAPDTVDRPIVKENKPSSINNVKEYNETEQIFDVKIVENILHESRRDDMRAEKVSLQENWSRLTNAASNTTAAVARLLRDGMLIANGVDKLLIVYNLAAYCNRLMSPKTHKEAIDILKITFGKDYDFIALPDNTWQEKRKEYYDQYAIGIKYPKLTKINNPELKVVVFRDENKKEDSVFDKVTAIFGNNVRREE